MVDKILHWGCLPAERDGGAVVNFYLWSKYYELFPMVEQYGIPKNIEELDPTAMPFISYLQGDKLGGQISEFMSRFGIPVVEAFHIAENICPHIEPIHNVGGKVILHQTVHWDNDQVFKCKLLNQLDHVVAPTVYAKKILTVKGKIKASNITVIPHGVDTRKFYPHKTLLRREWGLQNKPVILYCGRLDTWKGVHQLIKCFKPLIRDYNAVFIIRGEDFSKERKLDRIFSLIHKNNPNVIYLPEWEPPAFIEELMATCDIYVSPTGHEGFNVPLVEAMACGKSVLTTRLPNHEEILYGTDNPLMTPTVKVGVVNEEKDVLVPRSDEIYGGLKLLLEDPERCKLLGLKGRKNVMERFDLTQVAIKWHKLFNKMIPQNYDMSTEMVKVLVLET